MTAGELAGLAVPLTVCAAAVIILLSKREMFAEFTSGAEEGIKTAVKLLPALIALIIGVKLLTASGFVGLLASFLDAPLAAVGVPAEILPLLLTRPFSGGGATAMLSELFATEGADSFVGLAASVLTGSSDTVFYILSVYFSAAGVTKTRYAFPAAIVTMLFSTFFALFVTRLMLG